MKIFAFQNQEENKTDFAMYKKEETFAHNFLNSKHNLPENSALSQPKISMRNIFLPNNLTVVYSFKIEATYDPSRYYRIILFTDRISYFFHVV